jgi:hypothetical protein
MVGIAEVRTKVRASVESPSLPRHNPHAETVSPLTILVEDSDEK